MRVRGSFVDNPAGIPDEIDLYISKKKRFAHASARWRHGGSLGLSLSEIKRRAGDPSARSGVRLALAGAT